MKYIIQHRFCSGNKEGRGRYVFFVRPNTLRVIPLGMLELPLTFQEVAQDYLMVTFHIQVNYRIRDHQKIMELIDFTLDKNSKLDYNDEALSRLNRLVENKVRVVTKEYAQNRSLTDAIIQTEILRQEIQHQLIDLDRRFYIQILEVQVISARPDTEVLKIMELPAREEWHRLASASKLSHTAFMKRSEAQINLDEMNHNLRVGHIKKLIRDIENPAVPDKPELKKEPDQSKAGDPSSIKIEISNKNNNLFSE